MHLHKGKLQLKIIELAIKYDFLLFVVSNSRVKNGLPSHAGLPTREN